MADNNTFSVRMEDKDKDKLLKMIEESGKNNKEFMSSLLSSYELNKTKLEIPDIAKDIEGLQALTQRINEYYVNIGKRIEDTQKAKDIQYTKDVELYKGKIEELQSENQKLSSDYEALQAAYSNSCTDIEEGKKQLQQLRDIQESNKSLIEEYKSKIDTLSGIIEEYKGYKEENETVKGLLADSQAREVTKDSAIKQGEFDINNLNETIEKLKATHEQDLNTIKDKLNLEKDTAILELKKKHQQELEQLQDKYNKQIELYQTKYKNLLEELEKSKTTHTTKKNAEKKVTK